MNFSRYYREAFDPNIIGFNYIYGDIAEKTGYGRSFLIMPAAMILFTLLFVLVFHKRIQNREQA